MANNENLKPIKKGELSKEEAKKRGSAGGKKSVESRKAKKTMKEMLDYLLEKEITNKHGEKATTQEAISLALIRQALNGNVKAFALIRDTIGEKPTEKIENKNVNGITIQVVDEKHQKMMNDLKNANLN